MTLKDLLDKIGEPGAFDSLSAGWDESGKAMPPGIPPFLEECSVIENAEYCGLDKEAIQILLKTAKTVRENPMLVRLAWHISWDLFIRTGERTIPHDSWPKLENAGFEPGSPFYLLVVTSFVPLLKKAHSTRGFPDEVTRDTSRQISCFAENYRRGEKGSFGIYNSQLCWLRNYIFNCYVRLGRFEYWSRPYYLKIFVYRRKSGQEIAIFAPDGMKFDKGNYALEEGSIPPELSWTSTLEITKDEVIGHRVFPGGKTDRNLSKISLSEWDIVMQNGTDILDMHIPAGGGMSPELCAESFNSAKDFFSKWMPEKRHAAIVCHSWIFSPNMPEILPESSNLVKLQKMVNLFPIHSGHDGGLWFIFLQRPFDIATAPRETSLQKAVIAYLEKGGRFRAGGMFVLLSDFLTRSFNCSGDVEKGVVAKKDYRREI